MKKFIICCLLCIISVTTLLASEPLRIGIISDTHYLSEKLMDEGYAIDNYIHTSARDIKNVPALLDSVISEYAKSNIQVLLISGDITKDGEKQSHIDFVNRLKPLQDKGVRVFVVPGNHDINTNKAKRYVGNKTFDTDNTTPEDFATIYSNCGYKNAIKRDPASLSYLSSLNDNTWLLTIDIARGQYRKNGIKSEMISSQTEEWILDILKEAQEKQIRVLGMMHWGLVEHLPYQTELFPRYLIHDWKRLAGLFADNGMKAIFTGHFHSNDISAFNTNSGNTIYDIETGPLCCYPFVYRLAELTEEGINISTKRISSLPRVPMLAEQNKALLKLLVEKTAAQKLKSFGFSTDDKSTKELTDIVSRLFLLHVAGDEKIDETLKKRMTQLSELLGTYDEDETVIPELDFPPADNNILIKF